MTDLSKLTVEDVLHGAKTSLHEFMVASHKRGYTRLLASFDNGVLQDVWVDWSMDKAYYGPAEPLLQVGTGSVNCTCDGCVEHANCVEDWASDDGDAVAYLEKQIEDRIEELHQQWLVNNERREYERLLN